MILEPCCVCRVRLARARMVVLTLTPEERAFVLRDSGRDITESLYCKPCLALLSDRHRGANLMKGMLEIELRAKGVPEPEKYSKRLYEFWLEKSAGKERS